MTAIASLLAEAWQELRIHKLRVLLSLIGVGVAVCALTLVVALGAITERVQMESFERLAGRPVTLSFSAPNLQSAADYTAFRRKLETEAERFDISYITAVSEGFGAVAINGTPHEVDLSAVDPDYRVMRHEILVAGRWFEASDKENMSPPVVVSTNLLEDSGISPADLPTTLTTPAGTTATIIGAVQGDSVFGGRTVMFMPEHMPVMSEQPDYSSLRFELWVPEDNFEELQKQVSAAFKGSLGVASVERSDYGEDGETGLELIKTILLAIAGIILAMGVLGMINIAVVTIQQRIREIGIRRSFGATPGRVFFAVMMESVVGTFVAGLIGVMMAILLLRNPFVAAVLFEGLAEAPPFPLSAAAVGMAVALAVGGLAGLIPAFFATRIRIIDAIRT
ncbi:ABC transporter permease [Brevibacterium otitidis]|uniref:ABC transporter permease n=1 Tax=Brevibacterium otitidis TaxID=53364 RepID=A0ABV5WZ13_9MICO|nr:ABC transporter permease [Brevibacterium otitidis]